MRTTGIGAAPERQQQHSAGAGADTFLIFYIKRRIEQGGRLEWFEAPYCCEEDPPREWLLAEEAALLFEQDNRREIEESMIKRLEPRDKLNFRSFRKITRHYLDELNQRQEQEVAILALIAFTGMYARRLADLDLKQVEEERDEEWRNYRREIYQISIYGARILLTQLRGRWGEFCAEVAKLMEDVREKQKCCSPTLSSYGRQRTLLLGGSPQLCGISFPLMAICGVGAAAYILLRRCTT